MNFSPSNSLEEALPENVDFAEDWNQFLEQWTNLYRKVSAKINGKERAFYPLELEIQNNQQFFRTDDTQKYRNVFRKVFDFRSIAPGATANITHNISPINSFTKIYGTCITRVIDYRPIPYVSTAAVNQGIELKVTATTINVINGAAAPQITSGVIILEYLKN